MLVCRNDYTVAIDDNELGYSSALRVCCVCADDQINFHSLWLCWLCPPLWCLPHSWLPFLRPHSYLWSRLLNSILNMYSIIVLRFRFRVNQVRKIEILMAFAEDSLLTRAAPSLYEGDCTRESEICVLRKSIRSMVEINFRWRSLLLYQWIILRRLSYARHQRACAN